MNLTPEQQHYIDEATTYHAATEPQRVAYKAINTAARLFLETIFLQCPECADRTDALRKVREARMTANAAIACDGLVVPRDPE
jgi:hypothetical protein